jgi:hypothetical protein
MLCVFEATRELSFTQRRKASQRQNRLNEPEIHAT